MPTYTYKPAANSKPVTNTTNKGGIIYRIQRKFNPTIILDELSAETSRSNKDQSFKQEDRASVEFPMIKINDYILGAPEIVSMNIDCKNFLPTISLTVMFQDQQG